MAHNDIVAYLGSAFTVEWYLDERGRSQARDYFYSLSEDRQDAALALIKRMGDDGKIFDLTKFRNEGDKIFALKPQPDRYLCFFFTGKKLIITNAFEKKTNKLSKREKDRALLAKTSYEDRVKRKNYYA